MSSTTPSVPVVASSPLTRTRPAFEKLAIGPLMVLGECLSGGHYLEVLRLGKQMTVGRGAAPTYWEIHRGLMVESNGFVGAFYRGFLPWGLIQCLKGLPVLFVQNESMYQLQKRGGWSEHHAERMSGFIGGAVQGVFVNPFQKIKVAVVASEHLNSMPPLRAMREVIRQQGIVSLYDGVTVMMLRRSLDWGIRWSVSNEAKAFLLRYKRDHNPESSAVELTMLEMIGCGLVGGAFSALTHPIDNILTNSMKPLPPGSRRDVVSVIRRMYSESGPRAFTRAWGIKVVDNAYHMAWMYGVGNVLYSWCRTAFSVEKGKKHHSRNTKEAKPKRNQNSQISGS